MLEKLRKCAEQATGGAHSVGMLLVEICAGDAKAAELVEQDLENPDMSLKKCFLKMQEAARKKQSGGCYAMTNQEAEQIIREFYGLSGVEAMSQTASVQPAKVFDISDLL